MGLAGWMFNLAGASCGVDCPEGAVRKSVELGKAWLSPGSVYRLLDIAISPSYIEALLERPSPLAWSQMRTPNYSDQDRDPSPWEHRGEG